MADKNEQDELKASAGPIRITIEIERPAIGLMGAGGHLRSAVREALMSLREVLEAGIDTLETDEKPTDTAEKITID